MEKRFFERIYDRINYILNYLYVNNDDNKMSNNKQSKVNQNPNNVKVGDYCILDDRKDSRVKVFYITERKLFSTVGNHSTEIDTWDVMTRRLKPLTDEQI